MFWRKAVFIVLVVFCLSPLGSPAAALILGMGMALLVGMPFPELRGRWLEIIFGTSVALLGFGTDLTTLYGALKGGVVYAVAGAVVLIALVYLLSLLFKVPPLLGITNLRPVGGGSEHKLLTVYLVLNAVLLTALPLLAAYRGLTPDQIGMWSAIAVPDVCAATGVPQTLAHDAVNVTVPLILVKALLVTIVGWFLHERRTPEGRGIFVWFIPLYIIVAVLRTYAPVSIFPSIFDAFVNLGTAGVILSLFLLGTRMELRHLAGKAR
jgi:uncharacterized membrane protein YadS